MGIYLFGPFRLDAQQLLLTIGDEPLALGPKVVETLLALVERPGEVLTKAQLLDRIWPDGFVEEANLAQNVYVIRKALRAHWDVDAIVTLPRRGYRFAAPITLVPPARLSAEPPAVPAVRRPMALRRYAAAAGALLVLVMAFAGLAVARRTQAEARVAQQPLSVHGARLYAMGRYYWNRRTRAGVERSVRYFDAVTKSDPRNARGYAALADAYVIMAQYRYGPLKPHVYYKRALAYARTALGLDSRSAAAYAALGVVAYSEHDQAAAEAEYRRAIAFNPHFAPAHQWYGIALLTQGRGRRALKELQTAADLDPLSVATTAWLSEAAYFARRYGDAIAYARQTLDLSPKRIDAYETMGLAYEALGNYARAIQAYRTFAGKCKCRAESAALLAHVYAKMHRFGKAKAQLAIAQAGIASRRVDPEDVVMAFIAMGERNEALRLLQEGGHKDFDRPMIAIDPRMDPVRGDARFRAWTQGPA